MTHPDTLAVKDVLEERLRQVSAEGWTPEHDDAHKGGQLAIAAACYAINAATLIQRGTDALRKDYKSLSPGSCWPWDYKWWKPTNERRDLVKAAALILAEIERIDRADAKKKAWKPCSKCNSPARCYEYGGFAFGIEARVVRIIEAAVIKRLAAGVSVETYATLHHDDGYFTTKQREHDLRYSGPMRTEVVTLDQLNTAIAAARVRENERIAGWYYNNKHRLSVFEVPDAIRALLGK